MALNKKSAARIAAVLSGELGAPAAKLLLTRIKRAAATNNRSFTKTIKRIAKAIGKPKMQATAFTRQRKAA